MTFCQVKDQDVNILGKTQSKYSEITERNRHIDAVWLYKFTVTVMRWWMFMVKADAGDVAWIKEVLWLCWCCADYFGLSLCVWLCSSQMNSDSDWTQSSNTATKASFNSSRKSKIPSQCRVTTDLLPYFTHNPSLWVCPGRLKNWGRASEMKRRIWVHSI